LFFRTVFDGKGDDYAGKTCSTLSRFFVDHSSLPKSEIQHLVFTDIEDPRCRSLEKEEVFNVFDTDDEGGIFECYDVTSKTAYICSESGLFEMPAGSQFWFEPVRQVETIEGLDRIDTNQVKSMEGMFYDCNKLKDLDLTHWSTGKVENMSRMFAECSSLTRLNLNGWNVENVTDMFQMFFELLFIESPFCRRLEHG